MFIPIGDDNPRERTPFVNYSLLAANIAVFFLFTFPKPRPEILERFALTPSRAEPLAFLTSMFLHANLLHLAGNMLFLWIFGDNVEDRLGHVGYAVFYTACGLAAAALHMVTLPAHHPAYARLGLSPADIPMLGASGAISGVIGAYVLFYPRHRVKMLLWFYWFVDILYIPAFWWIGIWFLEQLLFARLGFTGVAYWAHIGGFLAGAAAGTAIRLGARLLPDPRRREPRALDRTLPERRPFLFLEDDAGIEFVGEAEDRYAVLLLDEELHAVGRIARAAAPVTGEEPRQVARRLEATRGMIARDLPRAAAERLQRELHVQGIPAALILYHRVNLPPEPRPVEAASWDDHAARLRAGGEVLPVPWTAPFLAVGARVGPSAFIDLFVARRVAFRLSDAPDVAYVRVDPRRRAEIPADLGAFARSLAERAPGAALNEAVRVLAHHGSWGWLHFKSARDHDDYLFWIYNLTISRAGSPRG
jgi:membrane associated rhomboid family serine protease